MKKLLCNLMAIGLAFSPVTTIVSCSKNSNSNNDGGNTPDNPDNPDNPDSTKNKLLVTNNITNYWTARQFLSKYYNVPLTDFALDWMDQSTLRLRPVHGTDFEKTYTTLEDFAINTGFSGDSNSSLLIFSDLTGPITGRKIELPYNFTLSKDTKTANLDQAKDGYFAALQLISGIKLDSSKYTYSFTASTSDTDDTLKGTFTIVNNDNENDTVTLDVKSHAISFDEFFDTYQIPGPVYLPDEIKSIETGDFSMLKSMYSPKGPTLMAYVNKYRDIDWQDSAISYYAADLEEFYTLITVHSLNNKAIFLDKNYSDDESSGTLSFGAKLIDEFNTTDFLKMGILREDSNGYVTRTDINFKSEDEINDIFFSYPNTIVQGENGNVEYNKGVCTTSPADGLTDIASTDDTYKNDTELNVFGNCYQFDNWSISSTTEDELKMKQEFVKELYDVTSFEVPDDQYLYNDVRVKKDGDSVYAYLNRYSNIYNNNVFKVMYYQGFNGTTSGAMDLYEGYDKTTGSYCFKLTQ